MVIEHRKISGRFAIKGAEKMDKGLYFSSGKFKYRPVSENEFLLAQPKLLSEVKGSPQG